MVDQRIRRTTTQGVRVDAIASLDDILILIAGTWQQRKPLLMTFANPGTAVLAQRNPDFARMMEGFDVVAPDGIAMVMAIRWLHKCTACRISFDATSLAPHVFQMAIEHDISIVLCGGHYGVAEHARRQLMANYPRLRVIGAFNGYGDREIVCQQIIRLNPGIVICGMGNIVQESFLVSLTENGWRGMGFTCGGFLDQMHRGLQYYPKIVDRLNLRWAYRLAKEPRRLWRRYLLDYPVFAFGLFKSLTIRSEKP